MHILKKIFFLFACLLMLLPMAQKRWAIFELKPLKGVIIANNSRIDFSSENWFSGEFQKQYELHLNDSVGFKNLFIRIHNQIDYSLFNKANAEDLAVGKHSVLHSPNQINSHLGRDFVGERAIDSILFKVQYLQKELKKKNIDLMLVFAPGKPTFYSENYPEWIDTSNRSISNYTYYTHRSRQLKLNHIDFNNYFLRMKDTSRYALYPRCGIHWSFYGAAIAADSILKYIEKTKNTDIPDLIWKNIEVTDEARDVDYDCGDLMNLLWKIPSPNMAYVNLGFEDDPKKKKPNVLVIADSYFWNINNMGIPEHLFNGYSYWYYNSTAYSKGAPDKGVSQLNLKEEIEKKDVIIIMGTEVNLYRFGYGFIENAYNLYKKKNS